MTRRIVCIFGACDAGRSPDDDDDFTRVRQTSRTNRSIDANGRSARDALRDGALALETCATTIASTPFDDDDERARDVRFLIASWRNARARAMTSESDGWLEPSAVARVATEALARLERASDDFVDDTSPMDAASLVINAINALDANEDVVDVVWFVSGRSTSAADDVDVDDPSAWSDAAMAMYGVFRAAFAFDRRSRGKVITCGAGSMPKEASAVASVVGAATGDAKEDVVVDVATRWRGALAFASANGSERVEIPGLSVRSALPMWTPMTTALRGAALRVVEIVRSGDVPSAYLSAWSESLCVIADEGIGGSTSLREEFFNAWRDACANAATWGDAPALVVRTQIAALTHRAGVYRDVVGDGALFLLYPHKSLTTATKMVNLEFHLRAFVTLPELLQKLSASVGDAKTKRNFSTFDNLSTIARQDALNEAEQGLLILSERQIAKTLDGEFSSREDDVADVADVVDAPTTIVERTVEAFSPDLTVKKSKVADLVDFATTTVSVGDSFSKSEYERRWENARDAKARFTILTRSSIQQQPVNELGFDEIVDALMERASSARQTDDSTTTANQCGVEGFLTETFTSCVDDELLGCLDYRRGNYEDQPRLTKSEANDTKVVALHVGDDSLPLSKKEQRRREIEEKREKMLRTLGVDPTKTTPPPARIQQYMTTTTTKAKAAKSTNRQESATTFLDSLDHDSEFDAPATTSIVGTTCPSCSSFLVPIAGMNNCYRCGSTLV